MSCATQSPSHSWLRDVLAAPLRGAVEFYRIAQERAALRDLPAERLSDLGLSRRELEHELRRPFWDASRDD